MKIIEFRRASEYDMDLLFRWKNDKLALENGLSNEPVKYEDHKKWFNKKIKSRDTYIFIVYNEESLIGQVRLEIEGDEGVISYSVDEKFRGMGFGFKIIENIENIIFTEKIRVNKIKAFVKTFNVASSKIFEKNKYIREFDYEKDCYIYKKELK